RFAEINIDKENVNRLKYFLQLFEATKEGGDVSQLQVDQVKQQLYGGVSVLYNDQQQYLDAIDRFKAQLGLPTDLPLQLDDAPLRPLIEHFARYEQVFIQFREVNKEALKYNSAEAVARLRGELRRLFTTSPVVKGVRFRTEIPARWASWEKLTQAEL